MGRELALRELLAQAYLIQCTGESCEQDMHAWLRHVRNIHPVTSYCSWPPMGGYVFNYLHNGTIHGLHVDPGGHDIIRAMATAGHPSPEMRSIWATISMLMQTANTHLAKSKYAQHAHHFRHWAELRETTVVSSNAGYEVSRIDTAVKVDYPSTTLQTKRFYVISHKELVGDRRSKDIQHYVCMANLHGPCTVLEINPPEQADGGLVSAPSMVGEELFYVRDDYRYCMAVREVVAAEMKLITEGRDNA
jgi:hypothetical protein